MTARKQRRLDRVAKKVIEYGADVIDSPEHQSCVQYIQHGNTTVRDHTISVACMCVKLAPAFRIKSDSYSDLVRAALLHDYFLYDWHIKDADRKGLHGFTHASAAVTCAAADFAVTPQMAQIMKTHMWPLNPAPPRSRTAIVLTLADKICSLNETFRKPLYSAIFAEIEGEIGGRA